MRRSVGIAIEVAIAVAFVAGLYAWTIYVPEDLWIPLKWVAMWVNTLVVFIVPLVWWKNYSKVHTFWILYAIAVVVHVLLYYWILNFVQNWPLIWFAFLNIPEWYLIGSILTRFLCGENQAK